MQFFIAFKSTPSPISLSCFSDPKWAQGIAQGSGESQTACLEISGWAIHNGLRYHSIRQYHLQEAMKVYYHVENEVIIPPLILTFYKEVQRNSGWGLSFHKV